MKTPKTDNLATPLTDVSSPQAPPPPPSSSQTQQQTQEQKDKDNKKKSDVKVSHRDQLYLQKNKERIKHHNRQNKSMKKHGTYYGDNNY